MKNTERSQEIKAHSEKLQVEDSEYNLIRYPERGICLYPCGNVRYLLQAIAQKYKERLFGGAGGGEEFHLEKCCAVS